MFHIFKENFKMKKLYTMVLAAALVGTIALMFLGKIGTISFFTLMSGKSKDKNLEYVEGKLIL